MGNWRAVARARIVGRPRRRTQTPTSVSPASGRLPARHDRLVSTWRAAARAHAVGWPLQRTRSTPASVCPRRGSDCSVATAFLCPCGERPATSSVKHASRTSELPPPHSCHVDATSSLPSGCNGTAVCGMKRQLFNSRGALTGVRRPGGSKAFRVAAADRVRFDTAPTFHERSNERSRPNAGLWSRRGRRGDRGCSRRTPPLGGGAGRH